jgi:abortive infection bacteriophage resistance protein
MAQYFDKKVTTYAEQKELLKNRGLIILDEDRVTRYLKQISYYRLSAYFIPYQREKDAFNSNVDFDQILQTYLFDRKLRLLVFDCIERVEVAIRSQIIYIMANNHRDSHWQDNPNLFVAPYTTKKGETIDPFKEFQSIIIKSCGSKNAEVFVKHYKSKYDRPSNPPSWMCVELLTIGELSRLYLGLKNTKDKQQIASFFGVHYKVFTSWLHTITYVRNICAHHARLWNRDFAIKPDVLRTPQNKWISSRFENNQRTFYFLCVLKYLMIAANPNNNLTSKLNALFAKYPQVPYKYIGIPSNENGELLPWDKEDLWRI